MKQSSMMVGPKLAALRAYQHSIIAPSAPAGSFDQAIADRGRVVFDQNCASCHMGTSGTDNNSGKMHAPAETGMNGDYAAWTLSKEYRTTPLRALLQHPPYFHDGSAKTLAEVVSHYDSARHVKLTALQQSDLVEYLRSK